MKIPLVLTRCKDPLLVEASFVFDLGPSFGLLVKASSVLFQGPFVLVVVAYSVSVSGQVASVVGSEVS